VGVRALPDVGDALRRDLLGDRQSLGTRGRLDETVQTRVEVGGAEEEVEDALVDADARGGQGTGLVDGQQKPAAQGRDRGQGTPMGIAECGQTQAEGREGELRTRGGRTRGRRARVDLGRRGQNQQVVLEGGEAEAGADGVQGGDAGERGFIGRGVRARHRTA
jgi:hypothetical protein